MYLQKSRIKYFVQRTSLAISDADSNIFVFVWLAPKCLKYNVLCLTFSGGFGIVFYIWNSNLLLGDNISELKRDFLAWVIIPSAPLFVAVDAVVLCSKPFLPQINNLNNTIQRHRHLFLSYKKASDIFAWFATEIYYLICIKVVSFEYDYAGYFSR